MSWKGMSKALSRLPHQLSSNSKKDATKDPVYDALEERYETKVKQVESFLSSVTTFRDQTCSLLEYQQVPSWLDIIDSTNDNNVPEETCRAYQDYAMAMEYCSQEVRQVVDQLDGAILQPLHDYIAMTKSIQKAIIKRQHKQLDYDRFRLSYQKLSNMADKSPSEEKNVFKLEGQLDVATKDYAYINDLLKTDLEHFLTLTHQLIPPLFDILYNTQCQVYGGIYARIYEIVTSHSGLAFKTMDQSIEQGYLALMAQRDVNQEINQLEMFKKENIYHHAPGKLSLQERTSLVNSPSSSPRPTIMAKPSLHQSSPTSYQSQPQQPTMTQSNHTLRRPPPPPPPKPKAFVKPIEYAQALYDFDAQQPGDLPLREGDRIEIIEKAEDWWKGRIGNQVGIFPGNYVQLI
ncbi:hypothetical protein BC941DRAFT_376739 [Chlamydoabsidia padenii]|nr:hypothetical protein BC941DRAFT_376739 [Chlamydoabsidia padenii]